MKGPKPTLHLNQFSELAHNKKCICVSKYLIDSVVDAGHGERV